MIRSRLIQPVAGALPDQGNLPMNPGWAMVLNAIPSGETNWIFETKLSLRATLSVAGDVLGCHVNRQNGTNSWKVYIGSSDKLLSLEPATWAETIHNTGFAVAGVDADFGWQMVGYGPHQVAVGGHAIECQLRQSDAGAFATMITNAEPEPPGHTAAGNWPPRAKFCAVWGDSVAIGNLFNVGPAKVYGNTCGFAWWVSADDSGGGANTFGTVDTHRGSQTTYGYLADDFGNITGMVGGPHFGAIFKTSAVYRVEYYAGEWIVNIERVSERYGTIWPNSIVVAGDEIYYMSLEGPAVLRRSGAPELIGENSILRTLFDDTWSVAGYTVSANSIPYLVYGEYFPTQGVITWYYRTTADQMDMALHYHIPTGRFSFSQRASIYTGAATLSGQLLAVCRSPRNDLKRYTAAQGGVFIDKFGKVWEANASGDHRWQHQPVFTTPRLLLARDEKSGMPRNVAPHAVMPYWELVSGAVLRPQFEPTIFQYRELGTNVLVASEAPTTVDDDGRVLYSELGVAPWTQVQVKLGNGTLDNLDQLAHFAGFELEFAERGEL